MEEPEVIKREKALNVFAQVLSEVVDQLYGEKMCFFLSVFPPNNEDAVADYVSNAKREEGIKALKITIKRFEEEAVIPVTKGQA